MSDQGRVEISRCWGKLDRGVQIFIFGKVSAVIVISP
jgi:hypothetical protein